MTGMNQKLIATRRALLITNGWRLISLLDPDGEFYPSWLSPSMQLIVDPIEQFQSSYSSHLAECSSHEWEEFIAQHNLRS